MLIWTAHLSKKKAVFSVIALGLAIAALVCLMSAPAPESHSKALQLLTNEDRVAYLTTYGWELDPEPVESLQFLLPDPLQEPYLSYNVLQQMQGFDLQPLCGSHVTRYTYTVINYPGRSHGVQANLYICEGAPVAGDIICTGENGFQTTLTPPQPAGRPPS